jgi:hypothetical protein
MVLLTVYHAREGNEKSLARCYDPYLNLLCVCVTLLGCASVKGVQGILLVFDHRSEE